MATSVPFAYASKDTVIFPDSVPEGGLTAALDIQIRSACFDAFLRRYVDYCKAHDSISTEANEANQQACMDTCTPSRMAISPPPNLKPPLKASPPTTVVIAKNL